MCQSHKNTSPQGRPDMAGAVACKSAAQVWQLRRAAQSVNMALRSELGQASRSGWQTFTLGHSKARFFFPLLLS